MLRRGMTVCQHETPTLPPTTLGRRDVFDGQHQAQPTGDRDHKEETK